MFIPNSKTLSNRLHLQRDDQLNIVAFDSPLQQVLQQQLQLLQLLNQQNKWQLWISTRPMLQRSWIKNAGLNEKKIIGLFHIASSNMVNLIEKALLNKTSSYIVACINEQLSEHDTYRLQMAVKTSGTHLFLIDDDYLNHDDFMTMSLTVHNIH